MNIQDLANALPGLNFAQLPATLELGVNLSLGIRSMAVESKARGCEVSAAVKFNQGAQSLEFSGASVNEESHAEVDIGGIAIPWRFYGTLHTHLESATSARITVDSVRGFADLVHRADKQRARIVQPGAAQTVAPLAYSTVDVMTMAEPAPKRGREYLSFLLCLPRTLYLLVWAADSAPNIQTLYQDLLAEAFEDIFQEVLETAFDLGEDDTFDLDLDILGDLLQPQCVPLTALLKVLRAHRIAVYAADVSTDGVTPELFSSMIREDLVRTHLPIKLKRFMT